MLGKVDGSCVVGRVGVVVGLIEVGSSDLRMVGAELVALLGRAVGSCVGRPVGVPVGFIELG